MVLLSIMALASCGGPVSEDDNSENNDILIVNGSTGTTTNNAEEGCTSDDACVDAAGGPVCDLDTGECVAECTTSEECVDHEAGPFCDPEVKACAPLPAGHLIGTGDGSPESVTLVEVFSPPSPVETPDLAFHPMRDELWVLQRPFEVDGECKQANPRSERCASLGGFTTILFEPGTESQTSRRLEDGNSWHFMRRPPAIAMGDDDMFATCGEAATGNFEDNDTMFIGPTLWSSDLSIYAQPSGGNGSHMDMLHATPWCMGIAHEKDNIYWTFNGHVGSLDRYNFHDDHGPGNDDHSDGEIFRYVEGELSRVPNIPSHMVYHEEDAHLYVADTGNERIVKLQTTSGREGGAFTPVYEPLADYGKMVDANLSEVVPAGTLKSPSGLALHDGVLYVTDHETSKFHAFDLEGNLLRTLDTGLPAGSLAGVAVGPEDRIWFVDMKTGTVYRIDV
jgi:hypothetical protein